MPHEPYECGSGFGNAPRRCCQSTWIKSGHTGLRRDQGKTNSRLSEGGQKEGGLHLGAGKRKGAPVRWSHRRSVRSGSRSWLHLHDEAWAPCGGQDSCAGGGTVFACHSTAARRKGAIRRPALRRDGGLGTRGLWCCVFLAGV